MHTPCKALVLAAGYGTRMRPLTDDRPKPLLPFRGRPVLAHTLEMLRDWGVREAVVNAHHLAGELVNWLRLNPTPGLRVSVSFEPGILGTGGPLSRAAWFLDERPFWICNADVACRLDPRPLLREHARAAPLATLWMLPDRGPRTVRVREGRVRDFAVKDPGGPDTFTFSGLHLTSRALLAHIPGETFSSIITAYQKAMAAGARVAGVAVPGSWWADLGTPEQLLAAHAEEMLGDRSSEFGVRSSKFGDGRSEIGARKSTHGAGRGAGFVSRARDVRVERGARLIDAVVDEGAVIRAGAVVRSAVVGRGAVVRGEVSRLVVPAAVALTAPEFAAARAAGFAADTAAECLDPRGSDRVFFRLRDDRRAGIAVRYGTARKENESFVPLARFLQASGVRAARVRIDRADLRFFVTEDLGRRDLLAAALEARGDDDALTRLYEPVIRLAARLHGLDPGSAEARALPLQPPFTRKLYAWEHNLFADHFLAARTDGTAREREFLLAELAAVARRLEDAPAALVHRDLQSTNVLLTARGPALIDFQGMRRGPAAYDLASLLADPYVMLPAPAQEALLARYVRLTGDAGTAERFAPACVQRLVQALGAYGRLGARPETRRFLQHIPSALEMLERFAQRVPGCPRLAGAAAAWRMASPGMG